MKRKIHFLAISGFLLIFPIFFYCCQINKKIYEKINVDVYSNSIIIPIKINGKTYNFELDTGAPTSISDNLFDSLQLPITDTLHAIDYYGNSALVKSSIIPEITIGKTRFSNVKVGIYNPIQSFSACDVKIDGYLGGDFFTDKIVLIDIKKNIVIITNQTSKLDLIQKNAINLKLIGEQNMPVIPIIFPSKNAGEYVMFDSGSSNYLYRLRKSVFNEMLKGKALTKENILYDINNEINGSGLFGTQKDTLNHVILFDTIKIGETYLLNCTATTFDSDSITKSIIGAPLLELGFVIMDYLNKKFYFNPYKNETNDLKPKHGCYFTYKNDKFYVEHVIPGSIADRNNIKKGYIFEKYNLIIFDSLSKCELLNLRTLMKPQEIDLYVFKNDEKEIEIIINN